MQENIRDTFVLSLAVGDNWVPVSTTTTKGLDTSFSTYDEELEQQEHDLYILTFSFVSKLYNKGTVKWHPLLRHFFIGARLKLEWNDTEIYFIIKDVAPEDKPDNVIYKITAQDEVSYLWSRHNLGYSYTTRNDQGDIAPKHIYNIARDILRDNYLASENENDELWSIVTYSSDANDAYDNSIGYNSLITQTMTLELENTNPYNALIEACNTVNAYMKVDFKNKTLDFFRKNDIKDSGYRYHPLRNLTQYSADYTGEEMCTLLHVHGGEDADGNIVTMIPPMPYSVQKYLELQSCFEFLAIKEDKTTEIINGTINNLLNTLNNIPEKLWSDFISSIKFLGFNDITIGPEDVDYYKSFNYLDSPIVYAGTKEPDQSQSYTTDLIIDYLYNLVTDAAEIRVRDYDDQSSNIYAFIKKIVNKKIKDESYKKILKLSSPLMMKDSERQYLSNYITNYDSKNIKINYFPNAKNFSENEYVHFYLQKHFSLTNTLGVDIIKWMVPGNFIQYPSFDAKDIEISPVIIAGGVCTNLECSITYRDADFGYVFRTSFTCTGQMPSLIEYSGMVNLVEPGKTVIIDYNFSRIDENNETQLLKEFPRESSISFGIFTDSNEKQYLKCIITNLQEPDNPYVSISNVLTGSYFDEHEYDVTIAPFDSHTVFKNLCPCIINNEFDQIAIYSNQNSVPFNLQDVEIDPSEGEMDGRVYALSQEPNIVHLSIRLDLDNIDLLNSNAVALENQSYKNYKNYIENIPNTPFTQFLYDINFFKSKMTENNYNNFHTLISQLNILSLIKQYLIYVKYNALYNLSQYRNVLVSEGEKYGAMCYDFVNKTDASTNIELDIQKTINYIEALPSKLGIQQIITDLGTDKDIYIEYGKDNYFYTMLQQYLEQYNQNKLLLTNALPVDKSKYSSVIDTLSSLCIPFYGLSVKVNNISMVAPSVYELLNNVVQNHLQNNSSTNGYSYYYNKIEELISNYCLKPIYQKFGQYIYEQTYENTEELNSVSLYNQAVAYFADLNRIHSSHSAEVIDIAALEQVQAPRLTIGNYISVYNPHTMEMLPYADLLGEIEEQQELYKYYQSINDSEALSETADKLESLQSEIINRYTANTGVENITYSEIEEKLYKDILYITSIKRTLRNPLQDSLSVEQSSRYKSIISKLIKSI